MINIRTIRKITECGGLTLKNGKIITYKSGYQVATKAVKAYNGNCGLWLENGVYYVDKSHRVSTKRDALALGRQCQQISILKWADMSLIYC